MAHVLVVDDDKGIRETLRFALEDANHIVHEATDGIAALDTLQKSKLPMVVLLDLMMPGLDGAGVLGAVSGDRRLATQFAYILVTANSKTLPLAFVNLLTNLEVPLLSKPFDIDRLLDVVDRAAARLK
ncbi:MAG: response regulator [Ktedonobacterales bacterium]